LMMSASDKQGRIGWWTYLAFDTTACVGECLANASKHHVTATCFVFRWDIGDIQFPHSFLPTHASVAWHGLVVSMAYQDHCCKAITSVCIDGGREDCGGCIVLCGFLLGIM
jgi:hypothetical protein